MRDKKRVKQGICKRCGRWGVTQWHHIFGGPKRKASDKYDLVIELCPDCHRELHAKPGANLYYKQEAQRAFEKKKTRAVWMNLMHKNYLEY
jgi:hypothetical protein